MVSPVQHAVDEELLSQALRWQAATARPDCDWDAFTAWLEASPAHRQAYDEVALLDACIDRHAAALHQAGAATVRRRPQLWVAAAAVFLLAAGLVYQLLPAWLAGNPRTFSASSASASLQLAGGMHVVLAPGSTLSVAGRRDERMTLDGSAWFDVPHDPERELAITVGAFQLRDIGTRFEVVAGGPLLKVAVAEGAVGVMLPGRTDAVPVRAGERLLVAGDPPIAEYGAAAADDLAGWRAGRLVFRNEPLSLVALQIGRHSGLAVTVDPAVAQRRFSGVLTIGDGTQLVAQLAGIMGLRVERAGSGVRLVAAGGQPSGR
jgi:transmembrane sensor